MNKKGQLSWNANLLGTAGVGQSSTPYPTPNTFQRTEVEESEGNKNRVKEKIYLGEQ